MQEMRYTEKQIMCGMYVCWCDAMGTETRFDADTQVYQYMKSEDLWNDTDLADVFYRFERQFGFESTLDEWIRELEIKGPFTLEEWERDVAPRFTFGVIARYIQKKAINTVSFQPVTVMNRECGPAGAFYGLQQVVTSTAEAWRAPCRFAPSTRILSVLRGSCLDRFWDELHWRTEQKVPQISRTWDFLIAAGCLVAGLATLIALPTTFATGNAVYAAGLFVYLLVFWILSSAYQYYSDPLPPELQTFRDLALFIADLDCDAVRPLQTDLLCKGEGESS